MTREQALAVHGPLVVRMVDRMMQLRLDRAKAMIDGKYNIETDEMPEGLDRFDEAVALIALVQAARFAELPRDYSTRNSDEMGAYFRLYSLTEGRTLTANDVVDLEAVLAELNDELGYQADKHHEARLSAFREIGGDELVKAVEAKDEAYIKASVEKAMAKFREMIA